MSGREPYSETPALFLFFHIGVWVKHWSLHSMFIYSYIGGQAISPPIAVSLSIRLHAFAFYLMTPPDSELLTALQRTCFWFSLFHTVSYSLTSHCRGHFWTFHWMRPCTYEHCRASHPAAAGVVHSSHWEQFWPHHEGSFTIFHLKGIASWKFRANLTLRNIWISLMLCYETVSILASILSKRY